MSLDLQPIHAALADATPGPWEWDPDSEEFQGRRPGMSPDPELDPMVGGDADADLIANAPTWLADLCDEVERLRRVLAGREREQNEAMDALARGRGWEDHPDYGYPFGEHTLATLAAETADEMARLRAGRDVEQAMLRNAMPMLAEVERLRATVKAVSDLHRPIPVYDECEHDADHGCEPIELNVYTGCTESQIGWGCKHCCYPNGWPGDECPHGGMHEGVTKDRACPTRIALDGGRDE